ncbi:MAG: hypothetical protein GX587_12230 [Bacteroidales bacterium]|nr:hypothetical protein [Bacteroidales bacterium]
MTKTIKGIIVMITLICMSVQSFGQDTITTGNKSVVYTFFVNWVPDQVNIPLIGFVNLAAGSHKGVQMGFVNVNQRRFDGTQMSFINTVGGEMNGAQLGFINTCGGSLKGAQLSFINTVPGTTKGAQMGFLNTSADSVNGVQLGFINTTAKHLDGAQIGFVNTSISLKGLQLSFVNTTKILNGFQLGFINIVDTLGSGFPLGFLSIVRKGGYRAFEVSLSELYPINISFKIGIKKLYTSFIASYSHNNKCFSFGMGLGSIIQMNNKLYFNPELSSQSDLSGENAQHQNLALNFGYQLSPKFSILLGPSVSWNHSKYYDAPFKPFFAIYEHDFNTRNHLVVGARLSLRYVLTD